MRYIYIVIIIVLAALASSCSSAVRFAEGGAGRSFASKGKSSFAVKNLPADAREGEAYRGTASYYSGVFNGRQTANGEIFDDREMTCAHKTLPFGTFLKVTNLNNDRTVIVRVNDRGPFVAGRDLDLSLRAAELLGMTRAGVAPVEYIVMSAD